MKKQLFGISLILFSIFLVVLDRDFILPGIVQYVYAFLPIIGLMICIIGLIEKENLNEK